MEIAGLILAAGSSSRLGYPKQLVKWGEYTLLQKAIEEAKKAGIISIYVVLGYSYEKIKKSIEHLSVQILYNKEWEEGMASSIRKGAYVLEKSNYDSVLIMLCDQPRITDAHLKNLIREFLIEDKNIIATLYDSKAGVPAVFSRKYFSELKYLKGDTGGKKIIEQNPQDVQLVKYDDASIDIDIKEDLY